LTHERVVIRTHKLRVYFSVYIVDLFLGNLPSGPGKPD